MGQLFSGVREVQEEFRQAEQDAWSRAGKGDAAWLKEWTARGGDPNAPDPAVESRELPLHRAARQGHVDCIQASLALIDGGAFVDVGSASGTPLQCAARHGRTEAAQLLLACNADALATFSGRIPAALAADAGHAELGRLLQRAAEQQARNPVAVAQRLEARRQADSAVGQKAKEVLAKELEDVEALEQDIVGKTLCLAPVLHFLLTHLCGPCARRTRAQGPVRVAATA